jgi:hypothetical protein
MFTTHYKRFEGKYPYVEKTAENPDAMKEPVIMMSTSRLRD